MSVPWGGVAASQLKTLQSNLTGKSYPDQNYFSEERGVTTNDILYIFRLRTRTTHHKTLTRKKILFLELLASDWLERRYNVTLIGQYKRTRSREPIEDALHFCFNKETHKAFT